MYRSLELMAGTANHSVALVDTGLWHCRIVDWLCTPEHDLVNTVFHNLIIVLILGGFFHNVHIGLNCTTWSRLTNPPYRSNTELDGLSTLT